MELDPSVSGGLWGSLQLRQTTYGFHLAGSDRAGAPADGEGLRAGTPPRGGWGLSSLLPSLGLSTCVLPVWSLNAGPGFPAGPGEPLPQKLLPPHTLSPSVSPSDRAGEGDLGVLEVRRRLQVPLGTLLWGWFSQN